MAEPLRILTLNNIASVGLKRFPASRYQIGSHETDPDAILVRSHDMHSMEIPASVKAIGRAGAGTNNIPVAELSARGRNIRAWPTNTSSPCRGCAPRSSN